MKTTMKLLVVLAVAFVLTTQLSPHVFPNNTPALRPNLRTYIAYRVETIWNSTSSFIASIFQKNETTMIANYQEELKKKQDKLVNVALKKLSQGVYAKDEGNTHSLVEVELDEITFIEHTFTINGKTITIRVPKDQQLPPQQVLEKIYGN